MTEQVCTAALAEILNEAARTGGDAALGPICRALAISALRTKAAYLNDLAGLLEGAGGAPVSEFGGTDARLMAEAIRDKPFFDAGEMIHDDPDAA